MNRLTLLVMLGCSAALTAYAAAQDADAYFYLYEGERVPLGVDGNRVARFVEPGRTARALGQGLDANADFSLGPASDHAIDGWSTMEVQYGADRARPPSIELVVSDLARTHPDQFISPVFENEQGPLLVTRDLLIGFHADILDEEVTALLEELDLGVILDRDFQGYPGLYRVRSSSNNGFTVLDQANLISEFPEVRYAEPDMIMTIEKHVLIPNDPDFSFLWGIHNTGQSGGWLNDFDMDGPEAWDITTGSSGIIVVVLDDGVDLTHVDINGTAGIDLAGVTPDGNHDPNNACDGHGSWVAGTIAARINNALYVTGIAPTCRVAPARINVSNEPCDNSGTGQLSWFSDALQWAVDNGARVTNTSLGLGFSNTVASAYTSTANQGLIHFASSGNGGVNSVGFPASVVSVIAVGAANPNGTRASFSNTGNELELMGPGSSIRTTNRGGGTATVSGTSFSSPYAAGVAALVLSRNSLLSSADVRQILASSAVDMGVEGFDTSTGNGMVNANDALIATPPPGPPGVFSLVSPADSATNVSTRPTFTWGLSLNTTTYLLEVDDQANFMSPEISIVTSDTIYEHVTPTLATATLFNWRVTANNTLGTEVSATRTFTTLSDPPGAFSLQTPANSAIDVSQTLTLIWTAATLVDDYVLKVSVNADLSDPLFDQVVFSTSFDIVSPLEPVTIFYWSVEARNEIGSTFSTPSPAQFTTVAAAPTQFTLNSPGAAATMTTQRPTFEWSDSVGEQSYTLTLDNDADLLSPLLVETGITTTSHQIEGGTMLDFTSYTWKVDALNEFGTTLATFAPRSFFTVFEVCFGDADASGFVDFNDVTSVLTNWGNTYGPGTGPGDADGNGIVNFTDINFVLSNWLDVCP